MAIFKRDWKPTTEKPVGSVWARPEMTVTFKAEVMPGKDRDERSFRVQKVRANGRVILHEFPGEHREGAFEPINFKRDISRKKA